MELLGDEVNLAARLMQHAQPGQVLVTGRVQWAASETFAWEAMPAVRVKGKSDPIPVLRLIGRTQAVTENMLCQGTLPVERPDSAGR